MRARAREPDRLADLHRRARAEPGRPSAHRPARCRAAPVRSNSNGVSLLPRSRPAWLAPDGNGAMTTSSRPVSSVTNATSLPSGEKRASVSLASRGAERRGRVVGQAPDHQVIVAAVRSAASTRTTNHPAKRWWPSACLHLRATVPRPSRSTVSVERGAAQRLGPRSRSRFRPAPSWP